MTDDLERNVTIPAGRIGLEGSLGLPSGAAGSVRATSSSRGYCATPDSVRC
jgi:hypothetical protein